MTRLMRRNPPTVSSTASVDVLVQDGFMSTEERAFPVLDDGNLVGLVSLDDVRSVVRERWANLTIGDIMTTVEELSTLTPDEDADEALQKLQQSDLRQLPVLENGRLTGLLRRRDILKWLQLQGAG